MREFVGSPHDIAVGRVAQSRGWIDPGALRSVYGSLPPHLGLADALVQHGLLSPAQVQDIYRELAAGQTVQLPPPAQGRTEVWAGPPGGAAATLPPGATPGSPPGADAASRLGPDGTATLAPGQVAGGSGSSLDAATLIGGGSAPAISASSTGALPQPGEVMAGRYGILRVLGQGGMGAVYLADDRQRGNQVALKVMLPGAAGDGALIRFQREAEALAKVDDHVGIVRIRDYGVEGGLPYAALDLIEGGDLRERIKAEGALPIDEAVRLTAEVARAIHHCHERNILHRDLKPANIMVRSADGAPFVTDFGLAYDSEDKTERLTQTGQVMGTPAYMPPEQAEGDKELMDARSDVYGLGAILYELLAGQVPFSGEGMSIIKKVLLDEPQDLREHRAEVSLDLARIQQKAMAKDSELRYPSAAALADDLERLQRGEPIQARPPTRAERMRWRRSQGDKRALAEFVGVRILLPLGLVLALALGAFQIRPRERFQVEGIFRERVPIVVAGQIAFPGTPAAGELKQEATLLANNLAAIHGVDLKNPERPDDSLRALLELEGPIADPQRRELLAAYLVRLDVAFGVRPRAASADLDAEAVTLDLLREYGFGRGDALKEAPLVPNKPPAGTPRNAAKLLRALAKVCDLLNEHEGSGWKDALDAKPEPWASGKLAEDLGGALEPFGGSEAWSEAVQIRQRAIKEKQAIAQVSILEKEIRAGRVNRRQTLAVLQRAAERLGEDRTVLETPLLKLGMAALEGFQSGGDSKELVEVFSDPHVADMIDWERAQARVKELGGKASPDSLARRYFKKGSKTPPASVLVLSLRLGMRFTFMKRQPDHYAAELSKLIEAGKRSLGGASGAAYLLYADAQSLRAHNSDTERANPDVLLRIATSYASALGPDALPLDLAPYEEVSIDRPRTPLAPRWARYAEARLYRVLCDYEHYLAASGAPLGAGRPQRLETLALTGLAWFLDRGSKASLGEQVHAINALAGRLIDAGRSLSPEDHSKAKLQLVSCLDEVIEALLKLSKRFAGAAQPEEVEVSEVDRGVPLKHVPRYLAGLLEAYFSALQFEDYPRCLARVRDVHSRYRASIGRSSRHLFKAGIQLCLGRHAVPGALDDALLELRSFIEHLERPAAQDKEGRYRMDGAQAWLAQVFALRKELAKGREVHEAALAAGGGTHPHWKKILPLLGEADPKDE